MTLIFARRVDGGVEIAADRRLSRPSGEYTDTYNKLYENDNFIMGFSGEALAGTIACGLLSQLNTHLVNDPDIVHSWVKIVHKKIQESLEEFQLFLIIVCKKTGTIVEIDDTGFVYYPHIATIGGGEHVAMFMLDNGYNPTSIFKYVNSKINGVSSEYDYKFVNLPK